MTTSSTGSGRDLTSPAVETMTTEAPTEERASLAARLTDAREVFDSLSIYVSEGSLAAMEIEQSQASIDAALSFLASQAAQPAEADGGTLRSSIFEVLRRHEVSEQCFAEIAALTYAATPKAPTSIAGEVDYREAAAIALFNARYGMTLKAWSDATRDHWLKRVDEALATPPAPNDDLRVALKEFCTAAECAAGCNEGGSEDEATSEIMSAMGSAMTVAYNRARHLLAQENRRG